MATDTGIPPPPPFDGEDLDDHNDVFVLRHMAATLNSLSTDWAKEKSAAQQHALVELFRQADKDRNQVE